MAHRVGPKTACQHCCHDCLTGPLVSHRCHDCLTGGVSPLLLPACLQPAPRTEAEVFVNIFQYIDRLMGIVRPRRVLYMAIGELHPASCTCGYSSSRMHVSLFIQPYACAVIHPTVCMCNYTSSRMQCGYSSSCMHVRLVIQPYACAISHPAICTCDYSPSRMHVRLFPVRDSHAFSSTTHYYGAHACVIHTACTTP